VFRQPAFRQSIARNGYVSSSEVTPWKVWDARYSMSEPHFCSDESLVFLSAENLIKGDQQWVKTLMIQTKRKWCVVLHAIWLTDCTLIQELFKRAFHFFVWIKLPWNVYSEFRCATAGWSHSSIAQAAKSNIFVALLPRTKCLQ